ncbi:MAG: hypothetical protein JWL97_3549 [Gemmatimonadales bacterium]|nr:hypothetical protein [Gemmatimonadales bacterium]
MIKIILAAAVLMDPPLTDSGYYVVHKPNEAACEVVEAKPDGTKLLMVGNTAFLNKEDAEAALRIAGECQPGLKQTQASQKPN